MFDVDEVCSVTDAKSWTDEMAASGMAMEESPFSELLGDEEKQLEFNSIEEFSKR